MVKIIMVILTIIYVHQNIFSKANTVLDICLDKNSSSEKYRLCLRVNGRKWDSQMLQFLEVRSH